MSSELTVYYSSIVVETDEATSTSSMPQEVLRIGPEGFCRILPLHPAWGGKKPPELS